VHKTGVFALPMLPIGGGFKNPLGHQLIAVIITAQRQLHSVRGLAHEPRVTYGIPAHIYLPCYGKEDASKAPDSQQMFRNTQKKPSLAKSW